MNSVIRRLATVATAFVFWCCAGPVNAAPLTLTLTPLGIADGFALSTFVGGYPAGGGYGPLAQAVLPNGQIVTPSSFDGTIYVFNDVDNQTLASSVVALPYACETSNCNYAMATAGGQAYGAQAFGGFYYKFAADGSRTLIPGAVATELRGSLGMWGNPVNGHLIAASNKGLVDIEPVAGTYTVINAGLFPDGVSVSKDGLTVYVENGGTIQSYNIATGALIQTYSTGHAPDGTGVIYGGLFDGDIIVNNNDGTVGLLNPITGLMDIIADSGSRGDFVSPDTNDGTLFLSQNQQVMRLSCGPDCSIGAPPPPTGLPEPGTLALLGFGLAGIAASRRRKH